MEIGSPVPLPSKIIGALPPGLADERPVELLEEFRAWIKLGMLKKTAPGRYVFFFFFTHICPLDVRLL